MASGSHAARPHLPKSPSRVQVKERGKKMRRPKPATVDAGFALALAILTVVGWLSYQEHLPKPVAPDDLFRVSQPWRAATRPARRDGQR